MTPYQEAQLFFRTLYGPYFTSSDGYVEIRFIAGNSISKWLPKCELTERDWEEVVQTNETHHVYFGVNPRPLSKAKKQDDIADIVCLWVDIDGKDCEGGKEEAVTRATAFSLPPTILVDSGHGVHCYWVLEKPILGITKDQRIPFKQRLSGLVDALGADASKLHLDSCLRLPGTANIKDRDHPVICAVLSLDETRRYTLEQFDGFRNAKYKEPKTHNDEVLPKFGDKTLTLGRTSTEEAKRALANLVVPDDIKHLILTGALIKGKKNYPSRSERDMAILCSLVWWGYDYETIRSIFYNPLLGCSDRFIERPEKALLWDVRQALEFVKRWAIEETPEAARITDIKNTKHLKAEDKRKLILDFVTSDLLLSDRPVGRGFKDEVFDRYYFFHSESKALMNLDSTEFYTFIRFRYRVPERDFDEIRDEMKTTIYHRLKTRVTPRRCSYWDRERFVLYVSDNANSIYRVDDESISTCDNGTDGVFFEYDPALTPWAFNPEQAVVNYFETPHEGCQVGDITMAPTNKLGLNLGRFENSYLNEFLVGRSQFSASGSNRLTPWLQRLMLVVYFYSIFFESKLREKPIACFVGTKESGKSFIATSIGKVFDGDSFEPSGLPKTADDLAVSMNRRRYLVMDNLDSRIPSDMLNLICAAATGVAWKKRELYKDDVEISIAPHCFLAITSREPRFTRDDMVSRLLLFTTQKIDRPISRSALMDPLVRARGAILTEALVNLQSIIKLLLIAESQGETIGATRCVSRLADWETFGRAICSRGSALLQFIDGLERMNEKKDELAIESEGVYLTLHYLTYDMRRDLGPMSPTDLYKELVAAAEEIKLTEFQKYCKSAQSMSKWFGNHDQELRRRFDIYIDEPPSGRRQYTICALAEGTVVLSKEDLVQKTGCTDDGEIREMLKEAFPEKWRKLSSGDYRIEK